MCAGMSSNEQLPSDEAATPLHAASRRESRERSGGRWSIGERCFISGAAVFAVVLVVTPHPFPFGPNYLFAALCGIVAAAITGMLTRFLAVWDRRQLERAGTALTPVPIARRLGRGVGALLSRVRGRWPSTRH